MNMQGTFDSGIKIQTEFYKIYKHQLDDNSPSGHKKVRTITDSVSTGNFTSYILNKFKTKKKKCFQSTLHIKPPEKNGWIIKQGD